MISRVDPALMLSFDDMLQLLVIQRQVRDDLLQPAVLALQLTQLSHSPKTS